MPRRARRRGDYGREEQLPLGEVGGEPQQEAPGRHSEANTGGSTINGSSGGSPPSESQSERKDFDDGMLADMNGVPTFAGLFAAVITSFLVDSLKNLQPDPAQQSVYYQQQSVAMLAQISQQIVSIAPQVSVLSTPPPPYPVFHPSKIDVAVNTFWLLGLVYSLSAAFFATLVQEWVRSYLGVFEQHDHPLKRARFRQFFFEGVWSVRGLASVATWMIRTSLMLFFLGVTISVFDVNTTIGAVMIVYILVPAILFQLVISALVRDLKMPDGSSLWILVWPISLVQNFMPSDLGKKLASMGIKACREWLVIEETDRRKRRDVRATRWLIERTAANAEMEPLVLAIPGSLNTEWGQDVWKKVSSQIHESEPRPYRMLQLLQLLPSPHPPEGAAVDTISRSVAYLFETCNHHSYFENEEARHRRMRACVEAAASLVCRLDYRLDWFGEVSKVVSEIGQIEKVNSPTTISDTSFIIRWTCLSLMDIQRILGRNKLRALVGNAVNGLVRCQTGHGQPDQTGREGAQRVDEYLKTAWERVADLRRAFEPWTQKRTRGQVEQILLTHEQQISELERIKSEADGRRSGDLCLSRCNGRRHSRFDAATPRCIIRRASPI
ncbi:hypothetical protein EDB85DRAFT_967470 [Lactarius pseudohatsudake]|nr:hypothetical protein EDB85DRAFT_967470 [Lactarius pseudohatsudake]